MSEKSLHHSHLDVTFAVGSNLLIIGPTAIDVDPARRDSGIIYCLVRFEAPWCKGGIGAALIPEDFVRLRSSLALFMKHEPGPVDICDLDGWFRMEGGWNVAHQVAAFKVTTPARIGPTDWCLWFEPSHYRDSMKACMELEFWMKPDSLEEPLAETEAVLEHIQQLRSDFDTKYGLDTDRECWNYWQP